MIYPKELFTANEVVTKENLRRYDAWQDRVYKRCEEIAPDYWKLDFKTRLDLKARAEREVLK